MVQNFLIGAESRGHKTKIYSVTKHTGLEKCNIKGSDLIVSSGWASYVNRIIHHYKIPNIVLFDPQIRPSYKFVRGHNNYWGCCWFRPHGRYIYNSELPPDRWEELKRFYSIEIKPWRKKGNHIVIAHQPNLGFDRESRKPFYDKVIKRCVGSGRPVIICTSPVESGKQVKLDEVAEWKKLGCRVVKGIDKAKLESAWCFVSSGGTTASKALFAGVPVFGNEPNITDPMRIERDFDKFVKNPPLPDRQPWFNWIAYQQWHMTDIGEGLAFDYMMSIKK